MRTIIVALCIFLVGGGSVQAQQPADPPSPAPRLTPMIALLLPGHGIQHHQKRQSLRPVVGTYARGCRESNDCDEPCDFCNKLAMCIPSSTGNCPPRTSPFRVACRDSDDCPGCDDCYDNVCVKTRGGLVEECGP
jgi:hypothetical protein